MNVPLRFLIGQKHIECGAQVAHAGNWTPRAPTAGPGISVYHTCLDTDHWATHRRRGPGILNGPVSREQGFKATNLSALVKAAEGSLEASGLLRALMKVEQNADVRS